MKHFWEIECKNALEKQLYRSIHLARTNPDYQIAHPTETKFQLSKAESGNCHECQPDAVKRITEAVTKKQQFYIMPAVERPKRLNRK